MNFTIWVLLVSILLSNFDLAAGQNMNWQQYCGNSHFSYYPGNLDTVLYSLLETNNGFGFFHKTLGRANAAALCRGDLKPEICRRCVGFASRRIRQVCPNQIEAVGWYPACFLRFSNRSMGLLYENKASTSYSFSQDEVSDSSYDQWNRAVAKLLRALRLGAVGGGPLRKYASGNISGPGVLTIFGTMQCTPDLSVTECNDCLVGGTEDIRLDNSTGITVYKANCVIRYETFRFFNSTWNPPQPASGNTKSTTVNIGVIVGPILVVVPVITVVGCFIFQRSQKQKKKDPSSSDSQPRFNDDSPEQNEHVMEDIIVTRESHSFSFSTIKAATNNFSSENKLGEGGFGPVYKGILQDGTEIAVKRLSMDSKQGLPEFKNEVELIIKLQHRNLVRLLGYCVKRYERLLIYEFMVNNSLDTFIFDPNKGKELDWAKRANIVSGIARGLLYLHEDSRLKIIHRDLKASNILLDREMNSRISDFGTARIFAFNQKEGSTNRIIGTYGYMAPEYAMLGVYSDKSDVFSFGVLLLEIVSGQPNNKFFHQDQHKDLLSTAWYLWQENKAEELIDPNLIQDCPVSEALRWINVALLCIQNYAEERPTMSTVLLMLDGSSATDLPFPSKPRPTYMNRRTTNSEQSTTSSDSTGHSSLGLSTDSTEASTTSDDTTEHIPLGLTMTSDDTTEHISLGLSTITDDTTEHSSLGLGTTSDETTGHSSIEETSSEVLSPIVEGCDPIVEECHP